MANRKFCINCADGAEITGNAEKHEIGPDGVVTFIGDDGLICAVAKHWNSLGYLTPEDAKPESMVTRHWWKFIWRVKNT